MTMNITTPGRAASAIALVAEVTATLAVSLWLGGTLALGAFVAPQVFGQLEREVAGPLMGTIFANFDRMVLVLAGVIIISEGIRAALEGVRGRIGLARLIAGLSLATLALVSALWLGPRINELFELGIRRGIGPEGAEMDQLHDWAVRLAKFAFALAIAWFTLGVMEHRRARSPSNAHERS